MIVATMLPASYF